MLTFLSYFLTKTMATAETQKTMLAKGVFILFLILCFMPFISTPMALALGLVFAWIFKHPYSSQSRKASRLLLQYAIVGLGFGMNLHESLKAGREGIVMTIISVFSILAIGVLLGKSLKLNRVISYLIATGTAICGGSAIGAVAPVIRAKDSEISVSIGTVFTLNAIALFIFPAIGHFFNLSQHEFGTWVAIAIHDTSSVVGASAAYGDEALKVATTVKLTRALWIIPLAVLTSFIFQNKSEKMYKPWFILFFVLAMLANTYCTLPGVLAAYIVAIAKRAFTITLFLIGTDLSIESIKQTGVKAFVLAIALWIIISTGSLAVIKLA